MKCNSDNSSYKDFETKRLKKIQKIIEKKQYNKALSKLKTIYKTTKNISTKVKSLFFMAKIHEFNGDISQALTFYLYVQKTLNEDVFASLKSEPDQELEIDDIFDDLPAIKPAYMRAVELEISVFYRLKNLKSQGLKSLEFLKRKALLLIELESNITFLDEFLDRIDRQKIEINRKVKKNYFWVGMAQNFYSKNFDISTSSSTIPMSYTGYGPKLSFGYTRESYYKGWMFGGGFSSIFGELSIESSGETDVDYFVKRKNFYILDGQMTYYIRPYGGESKFGIGADISYIAYSLNLPGDLSGFKENNLALNLVPHLLFEFEKKWLIFFSKVGVILPGKSLQFELGGKFNF